MVSTHYRCFVKVLLISLMLCLTLTTGPTAAVISVHDCELHSDTYICSGAQYRMHCNTSVHDFEYWTYLGKYQYHCWKNNCDCSGDKDNCSCSSNTSSSCFCTNYSSYSTITPAAIQVYDCREYAGTYICTGAHYHLYSDKNLLCNNFYPHNKYSKRHQHCINGTMNCLGDWYDCTCTGTTSSSCYCMNYNNTITYTTAVTSVYKCELYSDTYICTGAQYRMHCNTSVHEFYYSEYFHQCWNTNSICIGNKDTCRCFGETSSSCFCDNYTTITSPSPTTTDLNITGLLKDCKSQTTGRFIQNLLDCIDNITAEVLPLTDVQEFLDVVLNASETHLESLSTDQNKLVSAGNLLLKTSEKYISMLVKPTDTHDTVNITLNTAEIQVFMVGPNVTLDKIPQLITKNASMDIDLIGIAKKKNSAAVAFISYTSMENLLQPSFFNTSNDTVKTMMSTVISATLPKTTYTNLTKPVNFTLKHIREFDPKGSLSCVYWNITEWTVDGCSISQTNRSHTVCSCVHLSTFALIMQTDRPSKVEYHISSDPLLEVLNLVGVIVGLVSLTLTLLTFAFCRWNAGVNNVARINLCLSLLLAHLLFLLTQQFLNYIQPNEMLCAVISVVLHFLFLSSFVWMFIEAVLLFICVRNLSQISFRQRGPFSSRFLCVIGYVIALVVVSVSVGVGFEGYGSEQCWIKKEQGFIWSFLGPVCFILASNVILFISIIISLNSALSNLNTDISHMKQTRTIVFKTLAQFVVLGCPWILGFFTNNNNVVEILFLALNSQQGTFIFLIYCVLNNEVRQQYMNWMRVCVPGHKPRTISRVSPK